MGLMDRLRGELIDIIEWTDDSRDTLAWRFPRHQNEIKSGAKLVVREGQTAVFVDQGRLATLIIRGNIFCRSRSSLAPVAFWISEACCWGGTTSVAPAFALRYFTSRRLRDSDKIIVVSSCRFAIASFGIALPVPLKIRIPVENFFRLLG